ncbi:ABC transporter ATP-binding protein [Staphylococcus epidermidis]|uniref:ABC transporter ATP-binding protein n=2 Tax=Staphylococcus TaxID=1279 RepID=UPI00138AE314|nr:ABC transporter ATP-binding protein/permease [Staphylococcus epidermidis]MDH9610053.1 ABC transporter ATP-binding protein [Staphylococcus epidermidis]HEQ3959400.1 ABC transporter ATP-binding protein [Streptococcus pyogenes]
MKNGNPLFNILKKISIPKKIILYALIISALGSIIGLLVPWFTGEFVDKLNENLYNYKFLLIIFFVFLLNAVVSGLGLYLLSKFGEKIIFSIRQLVWNHIVYINVSFFDKNESGQLISRIIDDTKVINNFISQKFPNAFPDFLTIIGSLIMLFVLDWKMTISTFIIIPMFLLFLIPLGQITEKISNKKQNEIALFSGMIGRILSEIRLVKISNTENKESLKGKYHLRKIYDLGIKQAKISAVIEPISSILILLMIALVLGFGSWRVSNGYITSGNLVAMIFYVFQLIVPVTNLSTLLTDYKQAKGASYRIFNIINEDIERIDNGNDETPKSFSLKFDNVSFAYGYKNVINNLNLDIPENKVTAFVGPSGSGKSTILYLISRMYEVTEGSIYVGENPLNNLNLSKWRNKIGYVMQENFMMNGTIKENILYGVPEKTIKEKDLIYYAKKANCYDFINNLEDGFNTIVGERGIKLSGGQKQRISIARSLIKNPRLLLLDEITANLDSESEKKIQDAMTSLMQNRTTIIIAHRLSTIQKADQIVFLDNGNITGIGRHKDLYNNHQKYRDFVMNQQV